MNPTLHMSPAAAAAVLPASSAAEPAVAPAFLSFTRMIAAHAARDPWGIAFRDETRNLTWAELHAQVLRVARALVADGVRPGDRVALLALPSLEGLVALFGIVAARGCAVPLPVSATLDALDAMARDSGAARLLVDRTIGEGALALAGRHAVRHPRGVVFLDERGGEGEGDAGEGAFAGWLDRAPSDLPLPEAEPGDAFNIIYSSGTTGLPKGIVHLHGMRQAQARRDGFGFGPGSRTLLSTPLYSNTTLTPLIGSLAHGGACLLMRKFDAARFLALAADWRITHTMLVPVQYRRLLALPDFDGHDLSSLELSQSTGAPMEVALKREIVARWPGRFREVYGLTEGGVSCFLDAQAHPDKLDTVGRPVHGTEVFLIDEAGRRLPPGAADAIGEVVGRSPFMMAGYHARPEADAEIRWFDEAGRVHHRTGDIGRFDADGFLRLLDRRKDVIISGGHNIYAADLEAVLARHADVEDCAVIGVPSEAWGETPLALVVPRAGAAVDGPALRAWVDAQVGKTQRLGGLELRDALPRNALGKLSKKALREPYWQKAAPG